MKEENKEMGKPAKNLTSDEPARASSEPAKKCPICGKEFDSMQAYAGHMSWHGCMEKKNNIIFIHSFLPCLS